MDDSHLDSLTEQIASRKSILEADDLPRETIHVPEWGGTVYLQAIPFGSVEYQTFVQSQGTVDQAGVDKIGAWTRTLVRDINDQLRKTLVANGRIKDTIIDSLLGHVERTAAVFVDVVRRDVFTDIEEVLARRHVGAVILGVVGPDGEPIFTWEDAETLRRKNWGIVTVVAKEIYRLTEPVDPLEAKKSAPDRPQSEASV